MSIVNQQVIESRLRPLEQRYGENSDEVWAERLKIEAEYGMLLFKRPICRCLAVLHVRDDRAHAKDTAFTIVARTRCLFRARDRFIVPVEFHDLVVGGIFVGRRQQTPNAARPHLLSTYVETPLSSGWQMDTLQPGLAMTFCLRAHRDVADVRFDVMGLAAPSDVYDKERPWRIIEPAEPYDVTR